MEDNVENMTPLSVNDAEIEYSVRGDGEPLLLVHAGVFADWFAPMAISPTLEGFRIIRVRRAGYGPSVPKHSLTIKDHAHHLAVLAAHLGFGPFHLVGHSSGGQIALQLASDYPDLVQSLVLLEPAPCGPLQAPAVVELAEKSVGPAMAAFANGNLETAFDLFMGGVCDHAYRKLIDQRLGQLGYDRALRESSFFFRDESPAVMQWQFSSADAARIRQPVLIVEGAEGRKQGPFSQQVTDLTLKLLPHAEVSLILGVNHMMPLQDPDAVGRVISNFARRHPIVAAASSAGS